MLTNCRWLFSSACPIPLPMRPCPLSFGTAGGYDYIQYLQNAIPK